MHILDQQWSFWRDCYADFFFNNVYWKLSRRKKMFQEEDCTVWLSTPLLEYALVVYRMWAREASKEEQTSVISSALSANTTAWHTFSLHQIVTFCLRHPQALFLKKINKHLCWIYEFNASNGLRVKKKS